MAKSARPNLSAYFRHQIDQHVNGPRWNGPTLPATVAKIRGTVTDREIVVTMRDGAVWTWSGGRYAARKVSGCYAPLMPQPVATAPADPVAV